jgi:hypothetical protein
MGFDIWTFGHFKIDSTGLAGRLGRHTWPADLAGRLGRQTWPKDLAGRLGRQTWPADLASRLGRQNCPAMSGYRLVYYVLTATKLSAKNDAKI